ncbi:putative reverse transcriptase domain-containing protein [Tanacetum coccineum]
MMDCPEDLADYLTDRDDDDDEEEESSKDDVDDEEEEEDEDELLSISTSPSSPLTSYSSLLPHIPSPPLPVSSPLTSYSPPLPASPTRPLGYRAAMIRLRAKLPSTSHPLPLLPPIVLPHTRASMVMMRDVAPSTYILASRSKTPPLGTPLRLPIPLPTSSPPLLLPSTDCRADVPKVMLPPRERLCIALGPRYEIGESSSTPTTRPTRGFRADYCFIGTLDAEIRRDLDREIDRRAHARTTRLIESEVRASREAWVQSMDASNMTRSKVRALRTTALAQQTEIGDLRAADRRRQAQLAEALTALIDQGVVDALAACDADRSRNGDDSHSSGTGTEGVVGLTQWFERMETVFNISNCAIENQVKFATCTLHGVALTWWKSHVETVGQDATHSMPWNTLMKMMTAKYCPRNEIKKLEMEIWELKVENKRKFEETSRNNQNQQQQNKRQNTGKAYTAGSGEKKPYGGSKLLCSKCNYHHDGPCAPKCHKCNRVGHLALDCRSLTNANTANNQRGTKAGHAGTNPDSNVVTGTFLLNNYYASILFDTGADMSFVSTEFSSQINITPTTLDHYYDAELADGRIIGLNTIIRDYTLNFLNHSFNIDLMPVELGSFDVIIGMDWLAKYQAVIIYAEKIVHIPWGNETLIVHGDGSDPGNETRLNIISCTKTQKYMLKGCHVFLVHVTTKKTEDKSEGKRLEDVPIVRDFPEVFPEDLSGLPPTRQVEF